MCQRRPVLSPITPLAVRVLLLVALASLVSAFHGALPSLAAPPAAALAPDMVSPRSDGGLCLTVNGTDPSTVPSVVLDACRGTIQQMWTHDSVAEKWQTSLNTDYCLAANGTSSGNALNVRPCTDSRALTLEPNPTLADSWRIVGTSQVIDWGVYGYPAVAGQNGWSYQLFNWFQPDLDVVTTQGCAITYPVLATDTASYNRELACDHVAKIQPPYVTPANAIRDPSLWPGTVASGATTVTGRTFSFNLTFQDNGYTRMAAAPRNWKSTGLYAPAGQIVTVTVDNPLGLDLSGVYVYLGTHTDVLDPTHLSPGGSFLRYPNVVTKVKLKAGANQVRSPYGGLIELVSNTSRAGSIGVTIDNAVEAPYFVLGQTTEEEWLARRGAPAPWAEFESPLSVQSVPSSQVSGLSFARMSALCQFYDDVVWQHNTVSGLSDTEAPPHRIPQGQARNVTDTQITAGSAHSGYPAMYQPYIPMGDPSAMNERSTDPDWGLFHEQGHNYQMGAWSNVIGTEVTVNLFSIHAQQRLFGNSWMVDGNNYAAALAVLNDPTKTEKWGSLGLFAKLAVLDQLRLGFPELDWSLWAQLMRRYRELSSASYNAINTDQLKYETFAKFLCDITNTDIGPFFTAWTIPVGANALTYCSARPALTRQIWLLDGAPPMWYHPGGGSGGTLRELWSGVSGSNVADLTGIASYPSAPGLQEVLSTALEGRKDSGNSYGERLRAYVQPPVTGAYRFWLSADDSAQLRLSTDEDPANGTTIVSLVSTTGYRSFDAQVMSVQRSAEIPLEAGRRYYIEALHKENTGGDSVSVAWNVPTAGGLPAEARKVIAAQYLSPFTTDLAVGHALAPGQPGTVLPGQDVTFQVQAANSGTTAVKNV